MKYLLLILLLCMGCVSSYFTEEERKIVERLEKENPDFKEFGNRGGYEVMVWDRNLTDEERDVCYKRFLGYK